jgi:tRNA 2-thiouridine synthesizing protein A
MALDLSTLKVDKMIDARATACPGPLLDAKRAIAAVPVGGVLEVMSSDEGTKEDLGNIEEAGYWRLFVKRGK